MKIFALVLALLAGQSFAQLAPVPAPDPGVPVTTMRPSFLYINNRFPRPRPGRDFAIDDNLPDGGGVTPGRWPGESLGQVGRNGGAFRIFAARSHFAYDDPIVYPGQKGKSHLHVFFGNTQTGGTSTPLSIRSTGNTTAAGGTHNRSAYWVPAMIYVCDTPTKIAAGCDAKRNGDVIDPLFTTGLNVYYKGYFGIGLGPGDDPAAASYWWAFNHDTEAFPVGFRMIAGDPTRTTEPNSLSGFACRVSEAFEPKTNYIPGSGTGASGAYTTCAGSSRLIQIVHFPSCWNGIDLDSPSHNAHIIDYEQVPAGDTGDFRCPSGFTHSMPGVEYKLHYDISTPQLFADMKFYRLSSDHYDTALPAGYSNHGDWFNGWDQTIMDLWVLNCIVKGNDCHDNVIGPGSDSSHWRVLRSPSYR